MLWFKLCLKIMPAVRFFQGASHRYKPCLRCADGSGQVHCHDPDKGGEHPDAKSNLLIKQLIEARCRACKREPERLRCAAPRCPRPACLRPAPRAGSLSGPLGPLASPWAQPVGTPGRKDTKVGDTLALTLACPPPTGLYEAHSRSFQNLFLEPRGLPAAPLSSQGVVPCPVVLPCPHLFLYSQPFWSGLV